MSADMAQVEDMSQKIATGFDVSEARINIYFFSSKLFD